MARGTAPAPRARLNRSRVLEEAMRLVDEEGAGALTMRALAGRLGVEAMSLYSHVDGKRGLQDGIAELLWAEAERSYVVGQTWQETLRSLARALRGLGTRHPRSFPLLIGSDSLFTPMLRIYEAGMAAVRADGFDEARAAKAVNAVTGYAMGYAAMELSCLVVRPDHPERDLDAVVRLTRALPADAAPELVRVAHDALFDADEQFEFGLDALLTGLAA